MGQFIDVHQTFIEGQATLLSENAAKNKIAMVSALPGLHQEVLESCGDSCKNSSMLLVNPMAIALIESHSWPSNAAHTKPRSPLDCTCRWQSQAQVIP